MSTAQRSNLPAQALIPLSKTMQFEADYYNGINPRAKRVSVTIENTAFVFNTNATQENGEVVTQTYRYAIADSTVQTKLGNGKRLIDLPDDSRLETDFQELEKYLPQHRSGRFWRAVIYAENHKSVILVALIATVAFSWAFLQYGVPVVAKYAATATPVSIEKQLGQQTLDTLDHEKLGYFTTTELSETRQQSIRQALAAMCVKTQNCPEYQLNFRKSDAIGANAFALPGGQIVITDALITLADNKMLADSKTEQDKNAEDNNVTQRNNEILAVLAHELGHVKNRHALRQTLQATISGLLIVAITGDVSSIASGLPAVMLNMRYTRDLESDADQYALNSLNAACIPSDAFALILAKLEKSHKDAAHIPEILASHPDTRKRILPFLRSNGVCHSEH